MGDERERQKEWGLSGKDTWGWGTRGKDKNEWGKRGKYIMKWEMILEGKWGQKVSRVRRTRANN